MNTVWIVLLICITVGICWERWLNHRYRMAQLDAPLPQTSAIAGLQLSPVTAAPSYEPEDSVLVGVIPPPPDGFGYGGTG